MGGQGITGYVALSVGYTKLFRAIPQQKGDPTGSANRTLVPTRDTERLLDGLQAAHITENVHKRKNLQKMVKCLVL